MSKDELHSVARADVAPHVTMPDSMSGLLLWLLARFGVGVIFAAFTVYVYKDMRSDRAELFQAYRENIQVIQEFKSSLEKQSEEIRSIRSQRQ